MLTERAQRHALYQRFVAGQATEHDIAKFDDPWRSIWMLAETEVRYRAEEFPDEQWPFDDYRHPLRIAVASYCNHDDRYEEEEIVEKIGAGKKLPKFPTLSEIAANLKPVSWLWENWIPRGMLSIVGAYQGTGKSYFVMDLARAIIAGEEWPDGTPVGKTGAVIYVDAEGIPSLNNERAQKLGLDRDRMYMLAADDGEFFDLTQRKWQETLIDMVMILKPELIIIDSLSSISLRGQNSVEDTTGLLRFLAGLANFGGCGMLLIHHLRKPSSGQLSLPGISIHDFRGSGHITAMARTVIGLSVLQQNGSQFSLNGPRRIELAKTNLGPYPEPLGVRLVEDGPDKVHFEYGDAPAADTDKSMIDRCAEWLVELLEEEAMKPADIIELGEAEGYGRRTIYRARKRLGTQIHNTHGKNAPQNMWSLYPVEDGDSPDDEL